MCDDEKILAKPYKSDTVDISSYIVGNDILRYAVDFTKLDSSDDINNILINNVSNYTLNNNGLLLDTDNNAQLYYAYYLHRTFYFNIRFVLLNFNTSKQYISLLNFAGVDLIYIDTNTYDIYINYNSHKSLIFDRYSDNTTEINSISIFIYNDNTNKFICYYLDKYNRFLYIPSLDTNAVPYLTFFNDNYGIMSNNFSTGINVTLSSALFKSINILNTPKQMLEHEIKSLQKLNDLYIKYNITFFSVFDIPTVKHKYVYNSFNLEYNDLVTCIYSPIKLLKNITTPMSVYYSPKDNAYTFENAVIVFPNMKDIYTIILKIKFLYINYLYLDYGFLSTVDNKVYLTYRNLANIDFYYKNYGTMVFSFNPSKRLLFFYSEATNKINTLYNIPPYINGNIVFFTGMNNSSFSIKYIVGIKRPLTHSEIYACKNLSYDQNAVKYNCS